MRLVPLIGRALDLFRARFAGQRPASPGQGNGWPALQGELPTGPVRCVVVALDAPLPAFPRRAEHETLDYGVTRVLVTLHREPLALVDLPIPPEGLSDLDVAGQLWPAVVEKVNRHLKADGLPPVENLTALGLGEVPQARCVLERQHRLDRLGRPFVSVVVCTRDRSERLQGLLQGLLGQEYEPYEVVIVDNASKDGRTREAVEAAGDSRLRYVHEPVAGLSNARNAGLRASRGEFIAMTDDDVSVPPSWLSSLIGGFACGDGSRVVGAVTGPAPAMRLETPSQVQFETYGGFERGFDLLRFDTGLNRPRDASLFPYSAGHYGGGVNMAFRRSTLQRVRGFDPALGAGTRTRGGEDLLVFTEVLLSGEQIVYQPSALLFHDHRADEQALALQLEGYGRGFMAYMTALLWHRPARIPDVLWRVPLGVWRILNPALSPANPQKAGLASELLKLERLGMLRGPAAYVRSRLEMNRRGARRPW